MPTNETIVAPVAVLSTTVLPIDGTYRVETLRGDAREQVLTHIRGVPHYIGHPDTKAIVEALGAVPAPTKLFPGLRPGESAICVPIKQGLSSRAADGFTVHQAIQEIDTLDVRVITRTPDERGETKIYVCCRWLLDGDAHDPGETGTPVAAYTTAEEARAAAGALHIVEVPLRGDTRSREVHIACEALGDDNLGRPFGVYASYEEAEKAAGKYGIVVTMPIA